MSRLEYKPLQLLLMSSQVNTQANTNPPCMFRVQSETMWNATINYHCPNYNYGHNHCLIKYWLYLFTMSYMRG